MVHDVILIRNRHFQTEPRASSNRREIQLSEMRKGRVHEIFLELACYHVLLNLKRVQILDTNLPIPSNHFWSWFLAKLRTMVQERWICQRSMVVSNTGFFTDDIESSITRGPEQNLLEGNCLYAWKNGGG